jgi:hypothetical protein
LARLFIFKPLQKDEFAAAPTTVWSVPAVTLDPVAGYVKSLQGFGGLTYAVSVNMSKARAEMLLHGLALLFVGGVCLISLKKNKAFQFLSLFTAFLHACRFNADGKQKQYHLTPTTRLPSLSFLFFSFF